MLDNLAEVKLSSLMFLFSTLSFTPWSHLSLTLLYANILGETGVLLELLLIILTLIKGLGTLFSCPPTPRLCSPLYQS